LVLLFVLTVLGCESSGTPDSYLNKTTISDASYRTDSSFFSHKIDSLIKNKESAFYPKSYSSTSEIYIDTIVYSPDSLKSAFFVILKKPNSSLLVSDNPKGFHFDAKCFLAQRDSISEPWKVKWFRIMNINRYSEYESISSQIQKRYFEDLIKIKDETGKSRFGVNVNDLRFWDSPAWSEKSQMLEHNFSGNGG
tara:strand:- start:890 stop:1471 length:582 start_codon:yes stop_codon:yes gene_type:complete